MKKRLLMIIMFVFIIAGLCACSNASSKDDKDEKEETEEEDTSSKKSKKKKKKDKDKEDEGLVKVYFEEDYPDDLDDYDEFVLEEDDYAGPIVYAASKNVKNFKIYKISSIDEKEDSDDFTYTGYEVYSADKLSSKKPLLVTMLFYGDMPEYGFSYDDSEGNTRFFLTELGGKDGSIVVVGVDEIVITDSSSLFEDMENYQFYFMSGAGGWETNMRVYADGSFDGVYYDYDMGDTGPGYEENGTVYWCDFSGQLANPVETDHNCYEVDVLELNYDVEPGKEVIENGERKIYTGAYGLEDTDKLYVYAPEMNTSLLDEEYISWVQWEFYDPDLGDFAIPAEMPFYGIYNPNGAYGFYSESLLVNRNVLSNLVRIPGTVNVLDDYDYLEQTYEIVDRNEEQGFTIYNICFKNEDKLDMDEDRDALLDLCLSKMNITDTEYLYSYDREDGEYSSSMYNVTHLDDKDCLYVIWQEPDADVWYEARIITKDNYIYIYALNVESGSPFEGEAEMFILGGLNLYHMYSHDDHKFGIMNCPEGSISDSILAQVKSKTGNDGTYYLVADEIEWISGDDTDKLKEYGLTEEDVFNDYAIGGIDGKTKDYKISSSAMFFLQYGPGMSNPYPGYSLIDYLNDGPKELMMRLYLDENGEIVFGYEPYTP